MKFNTTAAAATIVLLRAGPVGVADTTDVKAHTTVEVLEEVGLRGVAELLPSLSSSDQTDRPSETG